MSRIIVVTSGKGGVGKTTISCNLGISLALKKNNVVIVDCDMGLNNLDVVMAIENEVIYDLDDVINNRCRISEALVQDIFCQNLYIMSSSKVKSEANIPSDRFYNLIMRLSDLFDYVIIDCPAGIDSGFHRAVSIAREAIVVTTPHISAIRDADKVISILSGYNLIDISLVINRVRGDLVMRGDMMSAGDISRLLGLKISGIIPEDDSLTIHNRLDNPNIIGTAHEAYNIFSNNILNNTNDVYDCTHKYRGLGGKIKLALRKDL